ncbi:hypothetical protein Arnit_0625 [Arcobacter nitrofigilis DSM 7299]|uniref:Uncharacterized protein n=1 Tax=Arcobacter nitrofigilis (strain ATCC 33309 / DSM 7299 / CCUG 15893 / LMG 7604 / NCTC 12251 / CI) TaxID=572480 RepID=D5V257_ARCNC|nr:hypothetical protein [Arcobacter nitrofigilis]ADG92290.1 hypothetical protein Arnit_0625 [Arcobacter nitrofigilis DSM 7299]
MEGSTLDSSNPSFKLGHGGSAETSPNMDYKSGSIASNTESITKDITKNQDSSSRIINSSSSQTFGGGAVGGLESQATQRDYNNDAKHKEQAI